MPPDLIKAGSLLGKFSSVVCVLAYDRAASRFCKSATKPLFEWDKGFIPKFFGDPAFKKAIYSLFSFGIVVKPLATAVSKPEVLMKSVLQIVGAPLVWALNTPEQYKPRGASNLKFIKPRGSVVCFADFDHRRLLLRFYEVHE